MSKKNFDPTDGKAVIEQDRNPGMCRTGGSRIIEAPAEAKKTPIKEKTTVKEETSSSDTGE